MQLLHDTQVIESTSSAKEAYSRILIGLLHFFLPTLVADANDCGGVRTGSREAATCCLGYMQAVLRLMQGTVA